MIAVVVSRADRASEHVGERLLALADWTEREDPDRPDGDGGGTYYLTDGFELRTFDDLHLHLDRPAAAFDQPDLLLFASRHSGETGPLLTAHATGNFGPAEFGGADRSLARAAPNALAALLAAFDERAPAEYEVGIECTHHGPTDVGCPSLFVELGSREAQWSDPTGARAVAQAILDCRGVAPDRERAVVGFGGGHYAPRFERVLRETDWAVGHVAADWCLDDLGSPDANRDLVRRAFERSNARHALVDGDRPALAGVVRDLGYRVVSETWLRETSGVPLSTVELLEAAVGDGRDGLRVGDRARGYEGELHATELPGELLDEALGVDRGAVRDEVSARALAFATDEGGSRVAGPVALADERDREAIVDALADVLEAKYDAVERRDDAVVARREAFDPEKARTLGVEEGPEFGALAAGEPVEVDGRTVPPEEVRTAREREFPL